MATITDVDHEAGVVTVGFDEWDERWEQEHAWRGCFAACLSRVGPREAQLEADAAVCILYPELRWVLHVADFVRRLQNMAQCVQCGKTRPRYTWGGPEQLPLCSAECAQDFRRARQTG